VGPPVAPAGRTALSAAVVAVAVAAIASPCGAERPLYELPRVDGEIRVDGVLDEPAWEDALELELRWEVEPGDNVPAPVRTVARICTSRGALFVAFEAFDPEPERIRARYADHDQMYQDDWVHVVLDTFDDGRRAFDFFVNPLGVQGDAVETTAGTFSRDWDAIWDSAGRLTGDGYVVEIAIPFRSLRFQPTGEEQVWGIDLVRSWPRLVRHKLTITPRDRDDSCYLCQLARFEGFAGASPGRNLELTPTLTGILAEERDPFPDGEWVERESEVEAGATVRWGVTPNLALSGTVNPDFSQVEADAAQLDVNTRFSLFFPEKRPFFLEGADIFSTPVRAVYTRTMADPAWGAKVSGKVGAGAVGAFLVSDDVTNLLLPGAEGSSTTVLDGESTAAVARYRQDVGASSTIGGLVTDRRGTGYRNTVVGADLDLRFTPADRLRMQLLGSQTRYPASLASERDQPVGTFDGHAADVLYRHATSRLEVYGRYAGVSPDFRADVGFVPQVGYRFYDAGVLPIWRHDDPGHWYTFLKGWVGWEYTEDWEGDMLRSAPGAFLEYRGPHQLSVFANVYWGRQTYRGVEYDDRVARLSVDFQPTRDIELGVDLDAGDGIDFAGERGGDRRRLSAAVTWYAGTRLSLAAAWIHETFDLDGPGAGAGRLYTAGLGEVRAVYQLTRRTFARLIVQYGETRADEELAVDREPLEESLLTQLLLSYRVNPWTAVYLGYSDTARGDRSVELTRDHRTVFVKLGYAFTP